MTQYLLPVGVDRQRIRDNFVNFIDGLDPKRAWEIEVKRFSKPRTSPQCRYLNGVAYRLLSDATGYERDDISEYMCGEYFGWREKKKPGKIIARIPIRTTTTNEDGKRDVLKTDPFFKYVEFVQRFGAKHGVYIPDPVRADFTDDRDDYEDAA